MKQYLDLLNDIMINGKPRKDRTGIGTIGVFGRQVRYDLTHKFPLLTTKKMFWKGIVHELLWFLKGQSNIKYLQDNGVHIWDEWADQDGNLGPTYPHQWRNYGGSGVDQIANLIDGLKKDPYSRRHLMVAWNPTDLPKMRLPPCHVMIQFFVEDDRLSSMMTQRSCDVFLGGPFNIASYSLLTHMIAQCTGLKVGEFIHSIADAHIYNNHIEQVKIQLSRQPLEHPTLLLTPGITDIDRFTYDDIKIINYKSHGAIKAEVAI